MRRRVLGRAGASQRAEQAPGVRAGRQPSQTAAACCLLRRWVQAAATAAQLFAARTPLASSDMPLHEHLGRRKSAATRCSCLLAGRPGRFVLRRQLRLGVACGREGRRSQDALCCAGVQGSEAFGPQPPKGEQAAGLQVGGHKQFAARSLPLLPATVAAQPATRANRPPCCHAAMPPCHSPLTGMWEAYSIVNSPLPCNRFIGQIEVYVGGKQVHWMHSTSTWPAGG